MNATPYTKSFEVRWNDIDPNRHLRSTGYNEYAIDTRVSCMLENGFNFGALQIAPVVFRDEIEYRREVHLHDKVTVTLQVAGLSTDAARWRLHHDVFSSDGQRAATIRATGAWLDLVTRKLAVPPEEVTATLRGLSRTDDYVTLEVNPT